MKEGKIPVEEGKSMKRRDEITRRFLNNDGNKLRACVRVAGLKKERLAGARVMFPLERKAIPTRQARKKDKELGSTARTGERFGEATFSPCKSDRGLSTIDHQQGSLDIEGSFQRTTLSKVSGVANDSSNKNHREGEVC